MLGGGIGQAPGFAAAVAAQGLRKLAPVHAGGAGQRPRHARPLWDGCLASGTGLAWRQLTSTLLAVT